MSVVPGSYGGNRPDWPGRLFIVEGIDGSGKSTQLTLLSQWLRSEGYPVVFSTWNSSPIVRETTKHGKKKKLLTPLTPMYDQPSPGRCCSAALVALLTVPWIAESAPACAASERICPPGTFSTCPSVPPTTPSAAPAVVEATCEVADSVAV